MGGGGGGGRGDDNVIVYKLVLQAYWAPLT